jgi:hypothetical protein
MQVVQGINSKRRASYFNIANSIGKVCKFCLYSLGDDIVRTFDLTAGSVQCVQCSVSLKLREGIEQEYRVRKTSRTSW